MGRLAGQRGTGGEWLSYVLKCGVTCSIKRERLPCMCQLQQLSLILFRSGYFEEKVFPHTQSPRQSNLSTLSTWPGFSGAGLHQLMPQKCGETSSQKSPAIKWDIPVSPASLSGTKYGNKVGSYSWALTNFG